MRSRVKETLPPSSHVPRGTSGLRPLQLLTKMAGVTTQRTARADYQASVIQRQIGRGIEGETLSVCTWCMRNLLVSMHVVLVNSTGWVQHGA